MGNWNRTPREIVWEILESWQFYGVEFDVSLYMHGPRHPRSQTRRTSVGKHKLDSADGIRAWRAHGSVQALPYGNRTRSSPAAYKGTTAFSRA